MSEKQSLKRKKPKFIRQDANKKKRLGKKWRKPKGIDSKLRLQKAGHRKLVRIGYGNAKAVRGTQKRLLPIRISTLKELEGIDSKKQGTIISSSVGTKLKLKIMKKAKENGITVLNIKDVDAYIKGIEEKRREKKEEKEKVKADKEKKKKELEKKAEEKKEEPAEKKKPEGEEELEKKIEEEEKKEKRELDKVLTKKE